MLLLKKLPKFETMRQCAQRYPELDLTATQTSLVLLRVASDLIAAINEELAERGISQGRFTILMLLENCPEEECKDQSLSPSDLAEMCGVSRASISGLPHDWSAMPWKFSASPIAHASTWALSRL